MIFWNEKKPKKKLVTMYYETYDIILLAIDVVDKEGFAFYFATSSIFVVEEEG